MCEHSALRYKPSSPGATSSASICDTGAVDGQGGSGGAAAAACSSAEALAVGCGPWGPWGMCWRCGTSTAEFVVTWAMAIKKLHYDTKCGL